eukprot:2845915-Pleurochrysis_carterae.AAC.1
MVQRRAGTTIHSNPTHWFFCLSFLKTTTAAPARGDIRRAVCHYTTLSTAVPSDRKPGRHVAPHGWCRAGSVAQSDDHH